MSNFLSFASQPDRNYCPTDDELQQIKSLLVEARTRLARIEQERDALAGEIAAYEALISPIRRIPDDVLEEIFSACLPSDRNCAMSASDAPLLLGRVCGRWRNVAFRTPSLWYSLHIAQPAVRGWLPRLSKDEAWENMISSKVAQRLAAARQWLERSGDCPLTISFVAAEGSDPHAQAAFFQLLVNYIRRWRVISLKFQLLAGSKLREHFDQLQREIRWGEPMNWSTLALLDGASLTHIDLSYCGPGILSIPIQWHRLTSMSFSENPANVTSEDLAQLFSRTTSLQSLDLSFNGTPPPLQTVQAIDSPVQKLWLSEPYNFMAQLVTSELTLLDIQRVREVDAGLQTLLHVLSCSKKLETLRIMSALGLDPLKQLFSALPTSLQMPLDPHRHVTGTPPRVAGSVRPRPARTGSESDSAPEDASTIRSPETNRIIQKRRTNAQSDPFSVSETTLETPHMTPPAQSAPGADGPRPSSPAWSEEQGILLTALESILTRAVATMGALQLEGESTPPTGHQAPNTKNPTFASVVSNTIPTSVRRAAIPPPQLVHSHTGTKPSPQPQPPTPPRRQRQKRSAFSGRRAIVRLVGDKPDPTTHTEVSIKVAVNNALRDEKISISGVSWTSNGNLILYSSAQFSGTQLVLCQDRIADALVNLWQLQRRPKVELDVPWTKVVVHNVPRAALDDTGDELWRQLEYQGYAREHISTVRPLLKDMQDIGQSHASWKINFSVATTGQHLLSQQGVVLWGAFCRVSRFRGSRPLSAPGTD
ncbi:hypothetical protein HMN09_00982600 [Mycena chlorophos]|uniref:F-box domain-containing protein n=1 Tax=Mycena chlorophos TaxID=658473 RepID=A0A8H6SJ27_MYCCL|nr:hypothetical protein HMN09_00982600 [Mycena chlorophos]